MSDTPRGPRVREPLRVDFRRLARLGWRERARLLRLWSAVGLLAIAVVLVLPRRWTASVTLVPAPQDGLKLDLSGAGFGLGGGGLSLGTGPTPQDQLKMVVSSRAVADSIAGRHALRARWKLQRLEQARERLAETTTITTPKEGQVVVAVEAESPALARDLAASYAGYGASESVRLKSSLAAQRRRYLEGRLRDLEAEIATAGARLRAFEEAHGAVALPEQAKETMDAAGQLQAQIALLETELAAARRYFTEQSSEVASLRDRVAASRVQLRKLAMSGGTLMLRGDALPALKQEYLQLTREQLSLTEVAELLRRVYEQARVEESNKVPSFSVLDAAELPERHSWPKRGLTVALSLAISMMMSLGHLYWREARTDARQVRMDSRAAPHSREARAGDDAGKDDDASPLFHRRRGRRAA